MEDRAKAVAKQEELKKRHQEEYHRFRTALQIISKDQNGIIVLRHIAKLAGFFKTSLVLKGGPGVMNGVDVEGTIANEGRRGLYLDIRRCMDDATRRTVESRGDDDEQTN
jgi:hypothetical protein